MAKTKTIEERRDAIERQVRNQGLNIDLVLNYARELARSQLSAERIADIERELGNGHDAGT
jgi:hypothetical protein